MRREILALALALAPPAATAAARSPAERKASAAYEEARRSYYALKADAKRRQYRHQWLDAVDRFEAVARAYPDSERAPDALYTSAELLSDLSHLSMLPEDLQRAVADYRRVLEKYPRHRLADDAALTLARIHAQRLDQPEQAEQILAQAERQLPRGDCAREIHALRDRLQASLDPSHREAAAAAAPPPPAKASPPVARAPDDKRPPKGRARPPAVEVHPAEEVAFDEGFHPTAKPPPAPAPAPAPAPTAAQAAHALARLGAGRDKEITIAEQLGLKVRRVVIDAGHGGHDSGAIGPRGVQEKDVALAIAQKLGHILESQGLEVVYTRAADAFLSLEKRAALANEARGDLFISIHCNSAAAGALRGVETYSLNIASDRYSIRLAARENSSSEKGISDLQFILADLATKANTEESSHLAQRVQGSLVGELSGKYSGVVDLGTKQALFYVLLGAKMPAILVETSFVSNPEEEKRLDSAAYQADVANAIASGVGEYLGNRRKLAKVGE
ncbi:MAG TPA: N-acetylmuramoyl-L-alanine amidase [Myxococcales bacterium]|nr:N-acetylmuramoyl-L-alanine amidase [Myxococcales bacterium]